MTFDNVGDSAAIAYHISLKSPRISQVLLQKERTGACRRSIDAVVRTHDGTGMAFYNTRTKGG